MGGFNLNKNKIIEKVYKNFSPSNEVLDNPYIGFTSFNQFRGDNLFSDTFGTGGWIKERYPLYDFIEREGNKTGFYPNCSVVYIRTLWRICEPEENKYNFSFIDDILSKCRENKQTLMFRIMPHTTRANEDIPDWLAARIEHPARPDEQRIKDSPVDDEFYLCFGRMIKAFGKRYDGHPLIYGVDISLSGAWGEGHGYEKVKPELLKWLIDCYTQSFKKTHIFGQICAPELVTYACETRSIGWRADGFGNPWHMNNYFPIQIHKMKDAWKKAPVTFESFWYLSEWKRQGWDIDELIEQSLKWHISTVNGKSSTIPFEWYPKVQEWLKKMGYRFAIRNINYLPIFLAGENNLFDLWIENRGVAPIYNKLPVRFRLKCENSVYILESELDVCKWMPGDNFEDVSLELPKEIKTGNYSLEIKIGGFDDYPLVKLAMETTVDDGWYYLVDVEVQ